MDDYFEQLARRRSVRRFDGVLPVSEQELAAVRAQFARLEPLDAAIATRMALAPREETTARRGEYSLLFYSGHGSHYLLNAGYMLEQMDLFLASRDLGACWMGMARPCTLCEDGLDYIIQLIFGHARPSEFRTGPEQFHRREISEIWEGEFDEEVKQAVRLAPSACNGQPLRYVSSAHTVTVCRCLPHRSFIPQNKRPFFNTIDAGIGLCFLETALRHQGISFERALAEGEMLAPGIVKIADYHV